MMNKSRLTRLSGLLLSGSLVCLGCGADPDSGSVPLPNEAPFSSEDGRYRLLVRLAHISDTHVIDEESPGRLAEFDGVVSTAWRPYEAYSAQLLDGMIRAVNRYHQEVAAIDLVIHTGDAVDNAQGNELGWFLQVMDGGPVDPRSGPDDREAGEVPEPLLDPHHPFEAEGIYTNGRHGALATIPWYGVVGNHDVYAAGNFPIIEAMSGRWISPLPLRCRPGFVLPVVLVPDGEWTYGPVSPANPGPPRLFDTPVRVAVNPDRAFIGRQDLLAEHFAAVSEPPGHGFDLPGHSRTWYSRLVAESVRLVVLDTTDVPVPVPGFPYSEGAISEGQLGWFRNELVRSREQREWVIVATHHPSGALSGLYDSAILPEGFRTLLNEFDNVILHLAGHSHRNRVFDRGGYIEIETGSTIDYPQTGRIVELRWREESAELVVNYTTISHRGASDPLSALREMAYGLAAKDAGRAARRSAEQISAASPGMADAKAWLAGADGDREGSAVLRKTGATGKDSQSKERSDRGRDGTAGA